MRILSPVNSANEAELVIEAGADELYCGVMPGSWKKSYSNVGSPNRREWEVSNMTGFNALDELVAVASNNDVPVYLTMNALYTEEQYDELQEFINQATKIGVTALIVADIGLLLNLGRMGWRGEIHLSTGGTAFNNESIAFYQENGVTRIVVPRQNRISEIIEIVKSNSSVEIETFVLNRGCKNIDGFCTFHHGVNEVRIPLWWRIPKKMHWDYYLLSMMKRLPRYFRDKISHSSAFGSVGACFLSYDVDINSDTATAEQKQTLRANLRNNFNLFTGFDACGACALWDQERAGVHSAKIIGRSNPICKKVKDVRFLKSCLDYIKEESPDTRKQFAEFVKKSYKNHYGVQCHEWCYYPDEDASIGAEVL